MDCGVRAPGLTAIAIAALIVAVCVRVFGRTKAIYAVFMLIGLLFSSALVFMPNLATLLPMQSLGEDSRRGEVTIADPVRTLGVQRAGVFDSTIIQSADPRALITWLENHGYHPAPSAWPAISNYVSRKWVFVVSRVSRDARGFALAALHPLEFTFLTSRAVYPMQLTAVENESCTVNLYVFGDRRAAAPHFEAERCDHIEDNWPQANKSAYRGMGIPGGGELSEVIAGATVGTKLTGALSAKQMRADAEVSWGRFWSKGRRVYSTLAAATVAANVALPLAVIGGMALLASGPEWSLDKEQNWDRCLLWAASCLVLGLLIFWSLPTVAIVGTQANGFS